MTLRDALAAADHRSASICIHVRGTSMPDQTPCEEYAARICADPAFREALVEAVAEAVRAEWPSHREGSSSTYNGYVAVTMGPEWTVLDPALPSSLDYAAIVARILGEEP